MLWPSQAQPITAPIPVYTGVNDGLVRETLNSPYKACPKSFSFFAYIACASALLSVALPYPQPSVELVGVPA